MGVKKYNQDFGGIATMYGTRCADGLTIHAGAFADCDGARVPLVWNHQHDKIGNVLGHAILEDRGDCIYAHCKLNNTPEGQKAREILANNDLTALSIYANNLSKKGKNVMHGMIREVSLVLAGANPGALIDTVSIAHSMGYTDPDEIAELDLDEAILYHGLDDAIDIEDEDDSEEELEDDSEEELAHADDSEEDLGDDEDFDLKAEFERMSPRDQKVCCAMVGAALEAAAAESENEEEEEEMKHNVFDAEGYTNDGPVLSLADRQQIIKDMKKYGTLKEAIKHNMEDENGVLAHAIIPSPNYPTNADGTTQTYGIANIDWLFPEAKYLNSGAPEFIKRDTNWVSHLMGSIHHTPFSRVKMMFADITEDEARARGYMKGKQKIEEVFTLLKRSFSPQTIYKKQKLDRDDIVDITDFDVVGWIREEMRFMLQEEIARAVLVGDGRNPASDDKIKETNICPIWKDDDLYTIKVRLPLVLNETEAARAKRIIRAAIKARKDYKGTGTPKMFTTADEHTEMLLLEDGNGYSLYKTDNELATKCRVSEIVEVPVMEGITEDVTVVVEEQSVVKTYGVAAIIVNPVDYNIGTDRGGEVNTFEDFDIDVNQHKYLIETRLSGALVRPKSAIVIEIEMPEEAG
ncbi:MAG: phage major capsid protein [Lachnospiraceae bacterium]|nr:phage major capsid protein [Lachnospiraceae bacterium]